MPRLTIRHEGKETSLAFEGSPLLSTVLSGQGLAVAHALSRGLKMRPLMLIALYACCVFRAKYTLPVLAALGIIDGFLK